MCGVWKLVGVQRLEASLFDVPQGSCESTESTRHALCTISQRLVLLYYASSGVALQNMSTVSDDSTAAACPQRPTCAYRCCDARDAMLRCLKKTQRGADLARALRLSDLSLILVQAQRVRVLEQFVQLAQPRFRFGQTSLRDAPRLLGC